MVRWIRPTENILLTAIRLFFIEVIEVEQYPERLTRVENRLDNVEANIAEIKAEVKQSATKSDLAELKDYFSDRDKQYNDKMWKLIFGLLLLFGGLMVVMFGIKEIPKLF